MSWVRVTVGAAGGVVDAVCERLQALGAASLSIEPSSGLPPGSSGEDLLEPGPGETPMWASIRISALFDAGQVPGGLHSRVQDVLADLHVSGIHLSSVQDQDWVGAWRQSAQPRCFGHGLWVLPHDAPVPAGAREVVRLDPGLAFGTGSHATTGLCLQWLARSSLAGRTVLDLGCGSGILAIAAARLGATRVLAVDHDPQALQACAENARRNHVHPVIHVSRELPVQAVDVVVANILANTLQSLAPRVTALAAPGASLVLSGILHDQVEQVWASYEPGFEDRKLQQQDEWVAISARRR